MISNCGHDERGKYSGGVAGDQTGTEWEVRTWYNRPWNYVLRHPDKRVRDLLVELARKSANNNNIGYDQGNRYSYWEQLKANNYDPAKITTPCESDCSSGVSAITKAVGYLLNIEALKGVSIYCYTGNLRAALKKAGFEVLTASKYLTSDKYLLAGDILLYENHHVALNLDTGSLADSGTSSSSSSSSATSYVVKSGDTLSKIAKQMGVSVTELAKFNGISNPDIINVGQVIKKPTSTATQPSNPATSSGSATIKAGQIHCNNFCGAGLTPDGIRGKLTKKAGIKVVQTAMNLDYGAKLKVDGVWGSLSASAIKGHTVRNGETQYMVTAVEILLMINNYDPNGVESPGEFGSGCEAAVRKYQKDHGLAVDGIVGYNTFMSLMGM